MPIIDPMCFSTSLRSTIPSMRHNAVTMIPITATDSTRRAHACMKVPSNKVILLSFAFSTGANQLP